MAFEVRVERDIAYGPHGRHKLDLYLPQGVERPSLVVYVHGGGFEHGDKSADAEKRLLPVAQLGLAIAAVNYRLAPEVAYPEPIKDIKAALAWLRANGAAFGVAAGEMGIWGASAGGYIASMVALTSGDPALTCESNDEDVKVAAAVIWFAPSDVRSSSSRSWLEQRVLPPPPEAKLFNVENPASDERALAASPQSRVHPDAPPFLLAHGDRDMIVPLRESEYLQQRLAGAGVASTLMTIGGAGHEGEEFDSGANLAMTAAFLRQHLSTIPT